MAIVTAEGRECRANIEPGIDVNLVDAAADWKDSDCSHGIDELLLTVQDFVHPGIPVGNSVSRSQSSLAAGKILSSQLRKYGYHLWTLHDALQPLLVEIAVDAQDDVIVIAQVVRPLFPYAAVAGIHVATDEEQARLVYSEPHSSRGCRVHGLELDGASVSQITPVVGGGGQLAAGKRSAREYLHGAIGESHAE